MAPTVLVLLSTAVVLLWSAGTTQAQAIATPCYTSTGCAGTSFTATSPRDCCVGTGSSYNNGPGTTCSNCTVWGFQDSNGDTITELLVSELGLSVSFEVFFTVIKGTRPGTRRADITSIPKTATTEDYSLTDSTGQFIATLPVTIEFSISTDSVALEGNETFCINVTLLSNIASIAPAANEFVADPLIVTIQDVNVIRLEFGQLDYRVKEGTNNNQLCVVVKTVENQNVILASELELMITPLTFQQQEAMGIPLPPDFPPKPVAASVNNITGRVDFKDSVHCVTVPAGRKVEDITVCIPICDDEIDEADEGFVVVLELKDPAKDISVDLSTRNATLGRIDDNDVLRIGFEQARYDFPESNELREAVVIKVDDTVTEQSYRIDVSASDVTTLNELDYVIGGGTTQRETIRPNEQNYSFPFEILEDSILERVECFTISLENVPEVEPRFETQGTITTTTVCISDRTPFVIGFRETLTNVEEDVGSFDISVAILSPDPVTVDPELTFSVLYSASGTAGTADYSPSFSLNFLTFSNGINETFITVTITDDDLFEGPETFSYTLTDVSPKFSLLTFAPNVTTVNIMDNDDITIGFVPVNYTVNEGAGEVLVNVSVLDGSIENSDTEIEVLLTPREGTGVEFVGSGSGDGTGDIFLQTYTVVFNQSATSHIVAIKFFDDMVYENPEFFFIDLSLTANSQNGVNLSPSTAAVTINDDDPVVIGFASTSHSVLESTGSAVVTVSVLSGTLGPGTQVGVLFSTMGVTATSDTDFSSVSGRQLTFNSSVTSIDVSVDILQDDIQEQLEQFSAGLTFSQSPPPMRVTLSPDATLINITDTDVVFVEFQPDSYSVGEGDGAVTLTLVKKGQTDLPVSVVVTTEDDSAEAGSDYDSVQETVTFQPGEMTKTVSVTIREDTVYEGEETFFAGLSLPPGETNVEIGDNDELNTTITDNDVVLFEFVPAVYSVTEGQTAVVLTVVKTGQSVVPVTVSFSTDDGSAKAGLDYTPITRVLTFAPNQVSQDVSVNIVDDAKVELDKEFFLASLSVPAGESGASIGAQDTANVTILDNDGIIIGPVNMTLSVPEDVGTFTLCFGIVGPPNVAIAEGVEVRVTESPEEGTADTNDFDEDQKELVFDSNKEIDCVDVTVTDDSLAENTETFTIVLNFVSTVNGPNVTVSGPLAITIIDNDGAITFVNDTIIGDPLFTVPILVPGFEEEEVSLCYEIHGDTGSYYNLISDSCTAVNVHYTAIQAGVRVNVIDAVYVSATDSADQCVKIQVNLEGCSASVNNVTVNRYALNDVSVRKFTNRVRISVPNCASTKLVMYVMCQERPVVDPDDINVVINAKLIKYVVTRGLNLSPGSHGLIAQFWGIKIDVVPYNGTDDDGVNVQNHYIVTVDHPDAPERKFIGSMYFLTWEFEETPCIYAGNGQGGPLAEFSTTSTNDPVIQGEYTDYSVTRPFEVDFVYAIEDEGSCNP